jgi:hypothetical protein
LASRVSVERACAIVIEGKTGLRAVAPNPAISLRRSSGNLGLVIGPMRTIFYLICPAATPWPGRLKKGHFFAANGLAHVISPPPAASRPDMMLSAGVAELVDALDLGSSDESCGGSSPSARTKRFQRLPNEYWRACFPGWGFGSAAPPAQAFRPRVDPIDNVAAIRPDESGRRLTPCRSPKPSPRD